MALGLIAFTYTNAQSKPCEIKLSGLVIDSSDLVGLSNTVLSIASIKAEAKTDKNGRFTFTGLCAGTYELHISHLNCEHIHLTLQLDKDSIITIQLKHIDKELIGFKLSSKADKSTELKRLNSKDLESRKGQSISAMMQDLAGVNLLKTGGTVSKPMVNGLFGNRVVLVNNGIRQEGQNWGMEHAPEIDAFLATEIELIKGAESLRYGADGIGGVILVKPKSIFSEKLKQLNGELNLIGNSNGRGKTSNIILGSLLGRKVPIALRVQGSIKQFGNYRTAQDLVDNTGSSERNYSVHIGFQKRGFQTELFYSEFYNKIGIYTGSQIGNLSDLETAMQSKKPLIPSDFTYLIDRPYQVVDHRLLKYRNALQVNAKNQVELTLSFQRNHREEYDILRSATSFKGPAFDYYISSSMGELLWTKNNFHQINWKAGLIGLHQSNAYTGRFFIPGFYQKSFAGFVMASKSYKKINIEASGRYDQKHFELFRWNTGQLNRTLRQFSGLAYVVKVEYLKESKHRISLTQSSTWRPPAPNELYSNGLHQGLASIEIGDSSLKAERSYSQSITYSYSGSKNKIEAESYFQRIKGFINLLPSKILLLTIRGAYPVFNYQQSDVALYGLNARWKHLFGPHYDLIMNVQLPYGQNLDLQKPLNLMPSMNSKISLAYHKKAFNLSTWCVYQSKQNRYTEGSDYLPPPEAYVLLGFDFNVEFKAFGQTIKTGISGDNVGNSSYRSYLNRTRYFTDEAGINLAAKLSIILNHKNKNKS